MMLQLGSFDDGVLVVTLQLRSFNNGIFVVGL
jgi:hypothetical protein